MGTGNLRQLVFCSALTTAATKTRTTTSTSIDQARQRREVVLDSSALHWRDADRNAAPSLPADEPAPVATADGDRVDGTQGIGQQTAVDGPLTSVLKGGFGLYPDATTHGAISGRPGSVATHPGLHDTGRGQCQTLFREVGI